MNLINTSDGLHKEVISSHVQTKIHNRYVCRNMCSNSIWQFKVDCNVSPSWNTCFPTPSPIAIKVRIDSPDTLLWCDFFRGFWTTVYSFGYQDGIFQGNTDYLNMCVEYPYTYKAEHVVQTGAGQEGRARIPIDPVTVTISEVSYKFKVVIPAFPRSLGDISVDVLPTGDVEVEGIVRAGEIRISMAPMVCNRGAQRIFPQGHFNINFTLPGPADPKFVSAKLDCDGVLEGAVLKCWIARYHYNDYESEESD